MPAHRHNIPADYDPFIDSDPPSRRVRQNCGHHRAINYDVAGGEGGRRRCLDCHAWLPSLTQLAARQDPDHRHEYRDGSRNVSVCTGCGLSPETGGPRP